MPRKRRKSWRYVSPQRRGAGVIALALLALLTYAYWYQTNDAEVRRKTEAYLRQLTGLRVSIDKAHFQLFGDIELERVRLYVPQSGSPDPIFRAGKVLMRHQPWDLLVSGRVRPAEITCVEPVMTLEYDAETGSLSLRKLMEMVRRRKLFHMKGDGVLPTIIARDGKLSIVDVEAGVRRYVDELPIELTMIPQGRDAYIISFQETAPDGRSVMGGQLKVDLREGRISQESGDFLLERLGRTLPHRYRQWRDRYQLTGKIQIPMVSPAEKLFEVNLVDVSMKSPAAEGGLELVHVSGKLIFRDGGITVDNISGRIPQAGNARFELTGQYFGFDANSPFELVAAIQYLSLPAPGEVTGALADALVGVRKNFQPVGKVDISVTVSRDAEGKTTYAGSASPKGMSAVFKPFPYLVENLRGIVAFSPGQVELKDITAQRGRTKIRINGKVFHDRQLRSYDIQVLASDVVFDEELRQSIPPGLSKVWKAMSPIGRCGFDVRVHRDRGDLYQHLDAHLILDGHGSILYDRFPYRIGEITGDAYISDRDVRIESVKGRAGRATCTIDGNLTAMGTEDWTADLTVTGRDLPIDDALIKAVGPGGAVARDALRPTGDTKEFTARLWRKAGQKYDYRIEARLEDVAFNLKAFPYEIAQSRGVIVIRPTKAIVEQLRGVHGKAIVTASGQIHLLGDGVGLDMKVAARDLLLDDEFAAALPERFKKVWARLSPGGLADMTLSLQQNLPGLADDYKFVLAAKDVSVVLSDFPYPITGIRGQIVATPAKVLLNNLISDSNGVHMEMDGTFIPKGDGWRAEVAVRGNAIPIDEKLLGALPGEFTVLAERFEPGGSCDFDIKQLQFARDGAAPTSQPAPQTQPAASPSSPRWRVNGRITLNGAKVNLGFGTKTVTGSATGVVGRDEQGIAVDANVELDRVSVGDHKVTEVKGQLVKSSASTVMKLEDLEASAHGGRLAGFAMIDLRSPLRYRMSVVVDRLDMKHLFNPAGDPNLPKMSGLLDGRIELIEKVGDIEARQASGVLRISQAKLYKLPVLLDLLTVVFLALPEGSTFTDGEVTYHLRGRKLVFDEIHMYGPTLSLVGSGTMQMDSRELKLTFLAGPPGKLPGLSGLAEEFLQGILREIAEIEVTGTLSNPKTRTRTLGSLEEVIRKLTTPEAK